MKHEPNFHFERVYQEKDTEKTYKKFKEALSNAQTFYEYCDGVCTETVYKDYQQVKIETSDGIIDGYIVCVDTITFGREKDSDAE